MLATERAPREPRTDPPHSCQGLKTEMQEIDSFSLLYPCPFFFFIFSLIFFLFFLSTFFLLVFLFFAHIYSLFNLIEKVFSKTENRPVRRPPCVVRPVHPAECRSGPVRRTLSNRATLCGHRQNDGRSSVDCRTNIARNFREFWRKKSADRQPATLQTMSRDRTGLFRCPPYQPNFTRFLPDLLTPVDVQISGTPAGGGLICDLSINQTTLDHVVCLLYSKKLALRHT